MAQRSDHLRNYKTFNEGDEVYTTASHYKSIVAKRPYTVIKCYKPWGFIDECQIMKIDIMTDRGYISSYATDRFFKTPAQERQDKINEIINVI